MKTTRLLKAEYEGIGIMLRRREDRTVSTQAISLTSGRLGTNLLGGSAGPDSLTFGLCCKFIPLTMLIP